MSVSGQGTVAQPSDNRALWGGFAFVLLTALLTVWTTIVRDDGTGEGYFMIILAAGVGAFAARFQPAGMARAMLGVAGMQVLLGLLIATAPITATAPGGPAQVLVFSGVFAGLWLAAAALFSLAARKAEAR